MKKSKTTKNTNEENDRLRSEIEQLRALNQALTDELDAIYEGHVEANKLFDEFMKPDERRILH